MQTSKILFRIVTLILAATLITACSKEARKGRLLAEADNYFKAGNYDKAKLSYLNVLQLDPANALAFERVGAMWQDEGAPLRAGAFLVRASVLDPSNAQNRIRLARCYVAMGRFADAKNEAVKVLEQLPDNGDAIIVLTEAARSKEDTEAAGEQLQKFPRKNDVSFYLASANLFFRKGDPAAAVNALRQALTVDPKSSTAHMAMGDLYLFQKDQKQAGEVLERLDQTYPDAALIKYQLARAYLQNKNTNQAKVALDEAVSINPNYDDAVLLLAQVNLSTGHPEPVIEPVTGLLKKHPGLRNAALLLAGAYGSLDRFDDAAVVLQEQARLTPQDPQPEIALGLTLRQAKKTDEARQAFEKAAQLAPNNLFPVDQLVDLDLLDKHFDAARQRIRRQFQKTPDLPAAHFFEGKILAAEGKWDSAEAELQKTLQLDPNFSSAYDLLAQSYFATNKLPQAVSQLQGLLSKDRKSTRLNSSHTVISYAVFCLKKNKKENGRPRRRGPGCLPVRSRRQRRAGVPGPGRRVGGIGCVTGSAVRASGNPERTEWRHP